MQLTTWVKALADQLEAQHGTMATRAFIEEIFRIGVIDHRLCKVLAIRQWVHEKLRTDRKISKMNAMKQAGDHFGCTYEYVRKCMYYYIDLNL